MVSGRKRLGDMLVEKGVISQKQLQEALDVQKVTGKKFGEVLSTMGVVAEKDMMVFLQMQLGARCVDLSKESLDKSLVRVIPAGMAKRSNVIPVAIVDKKLEVAMEDPLDFVLISDLKRVSSMEITAVIASKESIQQAIRKLYGTDFAEKAARDFYDKQPKEAEESPEELDETANAPIVRLLDSIVEQAIQSGASDIHIEPFEKEIRVRFRIDGALQNILSLPTDLKSAIIARAKVLGNMNIAEKRVPQDGRVEVIINDRQTDLRLAIMPTTFGEKLVIRILSRNSGLISKHGIGMTKENISKFDELISNPHGIVLVTGPTGSGKTTTLYAMLQELNRENSNIITIEDPVEYMFHGINQTQVNIKAGLTFAIGLRALLRQDPDIVMVGEIRDGETAEIAVRAAITGHLVLSTLHTNDAISTVARLMDMGIDTYLLAVSLVGVISQRLLRSICKGCKQEYEVTEFECNMVGYKYREGLKLYRGAGCSLCNGSGYKGRFAVHEILVMNKGHRELIGKRASIDDIKEHSIKTGLSTIQEECLKSLELGQTTIEEVLRVSSAEKNKG